MARETKSINKTRDNFLSKILELCFVWIYDIISKEYFTIDIRYHSWL